MAGAAPKLEGSDSKYQDHPRVVACPRSVILRLRLSVLESFTSGPHGGAEVYGILFGTHSGKEVRIAEFRAIAFQSAMAGATPLSEEERRAFAAALGSKARESDPKELEPVGWFRAHPHSELNLTGRDLEIAGTFFPNPHQVVMILRPSDIQQSLVRFFYRDSGGVLNTESSFCELSVPPAFDAPPVMEAAGAPEGQPDADPSRSLEPAPPEADLSVTETEAEDDSVMLLPETPPVTRRRVSLVWPLALATAVGTLVAWYWLTQPPDRLALRVFDAGGQLNIMWEQVANTETGNLEIRDGGSLFSIQLSPDQLRSGAFTYKRHSESVNIRLEALRRGAGPLVESANFLGKNDTSGELNPPPTGSASREVSKPAPPSPAVVPKPQEFVVSVPVTKPREDHPKFSAPATSATRSPNQAPDLTPPPAIAQTLPPSVPVPVESLQPAVESPAPPKEPPAAVRPSQPAAPRTTPPVPVTPASGRLIWTGHLQKNEEVAISGKSCSTGSLIGELPGKPVKFTVSPGNFSSDGMVLYTANPQYANSVIESPGAQNGWNKTTYTWNPKYANDVIVKEAPSEQNQWSRVMLQSKNPRVSVVVIDWTLVN